MNWLKAAVGNSVNTVNKLYQDLRTHSVLSACSAGCHQRMPKEAGAAGYV